jgi:energy-coupling factor transport system substrate-specific component
MKVNDQKKLEMWKFGAQEVFYSAIGAALYMVLVVATNFLQIPAVKNVSFRPAAVIPMFFGVAFGPWVGLLSGLAGRIFSDLMSGQGFWPWWDLGYGLMGFLPGLIWLGLCNYRGIWEILKAEGMVVLGAGVGMGLASLSEIWVSHITFAETVEINFLPEFLSNIVNGLVLAPVLMIAYSAILAHRKSPDFEA